MDFLKIVSNLQDYQTSSLDSFADMISKYKKENEITFSKEQLNIIYDRFFDEYDFCQNCGWIHDLGELTENNDCELVCDGCYEED